MLLRLSTVCHAIKPRPMCKPGDIRCLQAFAACISIHCHQHLILFPDNLNGCVRIKDLQFTLRCGTPLAMFQFPGHNGKSILSET